MFVQTNAMCDLPYNMDIRIGILNVRQVSAPIRNSSLEGATKLKFTLFCSSLDVLSDGILF